jgi:hypothetical protein
MTYRFTISRPARSGVLAVLALLPVIGSCAPGQLKDDGFGPPPGGLETINVVPGSVTLAADQSQAFQVSGTLSDGSSVVDFAVTWSATGGTITSDGFYTAGSTAGTFLVIATETNSGLADTSTVVISTATVTAVRLAPASVALVGGERQQFTVSATLSDGSTASVPVSWDATGGTITSGGRYTAGSTAGTFRVIATTANGLADTSAVTITIPTVTGITVSPDNPTLIVGEARQFSARATLSNGSTQANPTVTWSASGGTISAGGLYTAGSTTGTFFVAAVHASGLADTSIVTIVPVPPVDTVLAHLPPGMTTLIDERWDVKTPSGWTLQSCGSCEAKVSIQADATAPRSPSNVLQFIYEGEVGGQGAGARTHRWAGVTSLYVAFWFKHSSNWVSNSTAINKMMYLGTNQGNGTQNDNILNFENATTISFYQQNGIDDHRRMLPNVGGSFTLTKGRWHFIELVLTASTGGLLNGGLDIWVDGRQTHHRTDIRYKVGENAVFTGIDLDPILGGGPQNVNPAQYYWIDHLIIKGRN